LVYSGLVEDGDICAIPASLYILDAGIDTPEFKCPTTATTF